MACFPTYSWVLAVIPTLFLLFFNICVCVLDTAMSVCVVNSELRTRIDVIIMFEVFPTTSPVAMSCSPVYDNPDAIGTFFQV